MSRTEPSTESQPPRGRLIWLGGLLLSVAVISGAVYWLGGATTPASAARQALAEGDIEKAEKLVADALAETPDDPQLLIIKGRVMTEKQDWSAAVALFGLAGSSVERADDQRAWATALFQLERWEAASKLLLALSKSTPLDPSVWNDLTLCQLRRGDLENSLQSAQQLARLSDGELRGHLRLAEIHRQRDEFLESAEEYEIVLSGLERKKNGEAKLIARELILRSFGEMLLQDGRAQLASEILGAYVKAASGDSAEEIEGRYLHGQALAEVQADEQAGRQWEQVLEQSPKHIGARTGLADLAIRRGKPQQAIDWLAPVANWAEMPSDVAFQMQRAYRVMDDLAMERVWAQRYAYLRKWEFIRKKIEATSSHRQSYWIQVLYCHRLAFEQEWKRSGQIAEKLTQTFPAEFVIELLNAIREESAPPSLDNLAKEI